MSMRCRAIVRHTHILGPPHPITRAPRRPRPVFHAARTSLIVGALYAPGLLPSEARSLVDCKTNADVASSAPPSMSLARTRHMSRCHGVWSVLSCSPFLPYTTMLSPPGSDICHARAGHPLMHAAMSLLGQACAANAAGWDSHALHDAPSVEGNLAHMQPRFPYALPRHVTTHDGHALHTPKPIAGLGAISSTIGSCLIDARCCLSQRVVPRVLRLVDFWMAIQLSVLNSVTLDLSLQFRADYGDTAGQLTRLSTIVPAIWYNAMRT
ncbi:hypothetical protein EV121DRAFT_292434 [Schizophyllum commune]